MDISKIILWNNCYILIGDRTVFNKRLVEKGIVRIGDLIAENSEIMKCNTSKNSHHVKLRTGYSNAVEHQAFGLTRAYFGRDAIELTCGPM